MWEINRGCVSMCVCINLFFYVWFFFNVGGYMCVCVCWCAFERVGGETVRKRERVCCGWLTPGDLPGGGEYASDSSALHRAQLCRHLRVRHIHVILQTSILYYVWHCCAYLRLSQDCLIR